MLLVFSLLSVRKAINTIKVFFSTMQQDLTNSVNFYTSSSDESGFCNYVIKNMKENDTNAFSEASIHLPHF